MSRDKIVRTIKHSLMIGIPLGIIVAIFDEALMSIFGGFFEISFFGIMGSLLIAFFYSVFFHEMGHFVSFSMMGVSMRGLIVLGFSCIKRNRRWTMKLKPSLFKMMGGIAVPEIYELYSEDDLKVMQDKFSRALIYGPYASIIFTIASIIATILLNMMSYDLGFMLWFSLWNIMIMALVLYSSNMENEILIGDFKAYHRAKTDPFFVAQMMYQYKYFSENTDLKQAFLKSYIIDGLKDKLTEKDTHAYTISIVDLLLVEGLVDGQVEDIVVDYINMVADDIFLVKRLVSIEGVRNLIHHMIAYYKWCGDQVRMEMLFDITKNHSNPKNPTEMYLLKQSEQIVGENNHQVFLVDEKNVNMSMLQMLYDEFEGFGKLEKRYNSWLLSQ